MAEGWKDRCRDEFDELTTRIDRLQSMLDQWKDGTLGFTPNCPAYLLERQLAAMEEYRSVLIARNYIEHMWEV